MTDDQHAWSRALVNGWRVVSDETWQRCLDAAQAREEQKRRLASTRAWRGAASTHLPGLIGEALVASLAGIQPDYALRPGGDDGTDLPGVDVKTTTIERGGLVCPLGELRAPYYALVILRLAERRARYAGWATRRDVLNAPLRVLRAESGEQRYVAQGKLRLGLPPSLAYTPLRLS